MVNFVYLYFLVVVPYEFLFCFCLFCFCFLFFFFNLIYLIPINDEILTGTTTLSQSEPRSNGNEKVFQISKISRTGSSELEAV